MKKLVPLIAAALLAFPAAAAAKQPNDHFSRFFPNLPALNSQTPQQLADLATSQLDPNADTENNCPDGATVVDDCVGSGFTYFGQFFDHDLTLDRSPSPTSPVDPTTLTNFRTFKFDLDSVYGDGPKGDPQLYQADKKHFRVQEPNQFGVRDLPRNPDGSAILVEGRNDENQVIAQIHVALLKLHNRFVDDGNSFAKARELTTLYYQQAIVDDFLPHLLGPGKKRGPEAKVLKDGSTPVEFSVAAYRFGHSIVRKAYELTDLTGKLQVFNGTAADLSGGRPIGPGRQIDWDNFFPALDDNGEAHDVLNGTPNPAGHINIGRKIDTLISSGLFNLPIPGAEAAGSNVLAFRNMIRAKFYDMPSGQAVAKKMKVHVLTDAELNLPATLAPAFADGVPLWYYILREASVLANGERLGPVGSRIVGETFRGVLRNDKDSVLKGNKSFKPSKEIAGPDKKVQLSDLLRAAGVVDAD